VPKFPVTVPKPTTVRRTTSTLIAPKSGPALHMHPREDELWYVIDGDFRFKAGGAMLRASTGGMAFGPRGTPHAFQNIGDTPGRLLVISTPSGLERFFEDFAALMPGSVDAATLAAVGHANWVEFTGPPIAVSDPLPSLSSGDASRRVASRRAPHPVLCPTGRMTAAPVGLAVRIIVGQNPGHDVGSDPRSGDRRHPGERHRQPGVRGRR